jgi:hypothetical protein
MHGILDYATVIFLLASPTIFKMDGNLATITYALGVVHLSLTLLTAFEVGVIKVIQFRIHGLIEFAVSIVLIALAFWFNSNNNVEGFYFYTALAIIILLVFLLTDFKSAPQTT